MRPWNSPRDQHTSALQQSAVQVSSDLGTPTMGVMIKRGTAHRIGLRFLAQPYCHHSGPVHAACMVLHLSVNRHDRHNSCEFTSTGVVVSIGMARRRTSLQGIADWQVQASSTRQVY